MASTVNKAFEEFMEDTVNLDPDIVSTARKSRDNLLDNIDEFSENDGFFKLWKDKNIQFGSFARKTKCRELDDIDLMVCISADGATYSSYGRTWNNIVMRPGKNEAQKNCVDDYGYLSSTKVLNQFKKQLQKIREYSRSEINRHGEAVVLNLKSKDWSFDIVPCFLTAQESDGRSYYLIPNGNGGWKKTDPAIDRDHIIQTNQSHEGKVLGLIRLVKKWNKVKNAHTMSSYLLETMLINYCDTENNLEKYIDIRFRDALKYIHYNIGNDVYDLKEIQGNINDLRLADRMIIANKAKADYENASSAISFEINNEVKKSFTKWGEIFGSDFPKYG